MEGCITLDIRSSIPLELYRIGARAKITIVDPIPINNVFEGSRDKSRPGIYSDTIIYDNAGECCFIVPIG